MKVNFQLLDHLKKLAHAGTHPKVWVSAALVHRNKVISFGVNQMKTHPFQRNYGKNKEAIYWHAETSAIYTADKKLGFDKFENSILYIARVKYSCTDKLSFVAGLSFPCDGCLRCIKEYGIKTVIYTLDQMNDSKDHFGIYTL